MTDLKDRGPVEIELDALPELKEDRPLVASERPETQSRIAAIAGRQASPILRWAGSLFLAVVTLAFGVWAWDFAFGLLERNTVLGGIAFALIAGLILAVLALTLREVSAIARLGRIETIRTGAMAARAANDLNGAKASVELMGRLHSGRGDVAWGAARVATGAGELVDAGDLLDLAEREVLVPLDARALAEVEAAAARVATVTALVPVALADVAVALYSNVVMIRRIAEVYGGRSGTLGAWRLTRAVVAHLAATGAVAAGDDLIGSTLGGGVLSKLSRRFGEGLINGALTARVGITAMELCRPLPFVARQRPKVAATVRRALTGLFARESGS